MDPIRPLRRARRERRRPRSPNPEVRARLLAAAGELVAERGVSRLRVDAIAERAGLSVGTFYLYFEGKDDLFANLVIETTERLRGRMRAVYQGEGSVAERLGAALESYLDFVEQNASGFLYFRDAGTVHTTVGPLNVWALARHAEDLRPLLEEGMERGEVPRREPELLAQALVGLAQHMAGYWLEHRERYSRADVARFLRQLAEPVGLREEVPARPTLGRNRGEEGT